MAKIKQWRAVSVLALDKGAIWTNIGAAWGPNDKGDIIIHLNLIPAPQQDNVGNLVYKVRLRDSDYKEE